MLPGASHTRIAIAQVRMHWTIEDNMGAISGALDGSKYITHLLVDETGHLDASPVHPWREVFRMASAVKPNPSAEAVPPDVER